MANSPFLNSCLRDLIGNWSKLVTGKTIVSLLDSREVGFGPTYGRRISYGQGPRSVHSQTEYHSHRPKIRSSSYQRYPRRSPVRPWFGIASNGRNTRSNWTRDNRFGHRPTCLDISCIVAFEGCTGGRGSRIRNAYLHRSLKCTR